MKLVRSRCGPQKRQAHAARADALQISWRNARRVVGIGVMPAVTLFGRRWQISTDLLPLFGLFAIALYLLWFVYIIVAFFITVDIHGCNDSRVGRHYLATVCLFLTEYVISLLTAVCITLIGLRGRHEDFVTKCRAVAVCFIVLC